MKSHFTPEIVSREITNGNLSKPSAVEILTLLLEKSDNYVYRVECVEILGNLGIKDEKIFRILENSLLSDESVLVRTTATKSLINNFPISKKYINPLKYAIKTDKSGAFLKSLKELLSSKQEPRLNILKNELAQRIESRASELGVVLEEFQFLLDLEYEAEITLFNRKKSLELELNSNFFHHMPLKSYLSNSIKSILWDADAGFIAVKNKHIIGLNLGYWGLKNLPITIGQLSRLRCLILRNNELKNLPESLKNLRKLRILNLSGNYQLASVPESVITIAKKTIGKKYIWEGVVPDKAYVLGILEILYGEKLEKSEYDLKNCGWDSLCHYHINEKGHIIGIYIFDDDEYPRLSTIPKYHLSLLKFLECASLQLLKRDINVNYKTF
ncbi:MAG: leucine-rich repeat domain-containing protein [Promethearchaeota archaeon]